MHPLCPRASAQLRTWFRGLEMTLSRGMDPFIFSVVKRLKGRKKSGAGQVAAEKSQAVQTEPAVKGSIYGGEDTHAADTQRKRPSEKQSGDSESRTSCLFLRGWGG